MLGHSGKVAGLALGLVAGLLLGGAWLPTLLVVGLAAGGFLDHLGNPENARYRERPLSAEEIDREAHRVFVRCLASLLFHVGRADGEPTDAQLAAAQRYLFDELGLDAADKSEVNRTFAQAPVDGESVATACATCREALSEDERLRLVRALFEVASAEGPPSAVAGPAIDDCARRLGVDEGEVAAMRQDYVEHRPEAYDLLGVPAGASVDEIRRAFRALAARHHPDRVAHLGPAAAERARQRFLEVQEAYTAIRRERGF